MWQQILAVMQAELGEIEAIAICEWHCGSH
jgi:hypothetical protein